MISEIAGSLPDVIVAARHKLLCRQILIGNRCEVEKNMKESKL